MDSDALEEQSFLESAALLKYCPADHLFEPSYEAESEFLHACEES